MGGIVRTIVGGLGRRKGEGAGGDREKHRYPCCLQIQRCWAISKQMPCTGGCGESKRVSSRERKKILGTSGGVEGGGNSFCQSSELWGSLTPRAPGPLGLPEQRQLVTGEGDDTVCPQGYRRITTKGFQVILAI